MSAVKLASGYIELTVKKAGDALKEITAEITGIEKTATTTGEKAGKAISDGINKATKDVGKSIGDELNSAAERAGTDAGKKAGDALNKGIQDAAKKAGKSINDEIGTSATTAGQSAGKKAGDALDKTITDAAKKAGKKAGDAINDGVTDATKDTGKKAGASTFDDMVDLARKAGKEIGIDLDAEIQKAAGKAGKGLGEALGHAADAFKDTQIGTWITDVGTKVGQLATNIQPAVDAFGHVRDALTGIKEHDPVSVLSGTANALKDIGQTEAADKLQGIATQADGVQKAFQESKDNIKGTADGLLGLTNNSGKIAGGLQTISAAAGPLAIAFEGLKNMPGWLDHAGGVVDQIQGNKPFNAKDWLNTAIPGMGIVDRGMQSLGLAPNPHPAAPAAPTPMTPQQQQALQNVLIPPGLATGGVSGVTGAGQIYGPGSGTSDSILGVDGNGVPTARVSRGEGVVNKHAMDRGADQVVAMLNAGRLPGYDDGTTNVGGPSIPPPQIQVPQASTGQAGTFNQWLQSQQGHAYQYGTLYDCSGFMSQIYNQMTGKQMPRFNTESDLASYGFVQGGKPGTFQLGIHHGGPNAHMAGTLPDGRNVESAGMGVQIGAGAHGSSDKQFEDHWFLPGTEGMGSVNPAALTPGADATGGGGPLAGGAQRTQGFIPSGAGSSGQAGSSMFSGALQMGAQAINGLIQQAGSAAATAVAAAGAVGGGGGGAAAGPAASFAIGLGTQAAERGVSYGFQMAGIGIDALAQIFSPFGVPRLFNTDPTQFIPQLPGQPAAVTTGEKAQGQQDTPGQVPLPGGPVQPGQMPGAQAVGPPVKMPTGGGVTPAPAMTPGLGHWGSNPATTPSGPISAPQAPPAGTPMPSGPMAPPQAPQQNPMGLVVPGFPAAAGSTTTSTNPLGMILPGFPGMARGGVVGVFDNGGWLNPGDMAVNHGRTPEPILNGEQWGNVAALANQEVGKPDPAANGKNDYSVNISGITVTDVNDLQRQIDSRQKLQMMRYAGRP